MPKLVPGVVAESCGGAAAGAVARGCSSGGGAGVWRWQSAPDPLAMRCMRHSPVFAKTFQHSDAASAFGEVCVRRWVGGRRGDGVGGVTHRGEQPLAGIGHEEEPYLRSVSVLHGVRHHLRHTQAGYIGRVIGGQQVRDRPPCTRRGGVVAWQAQGHAHGIRLEPGFIICALGHATEDATGRYLDSGPSSFSHRPFAPALIGLS